MQGPKFVSDEEIERIKAKIEEDNKAIAALDIKNERQKYGEKTWFIVQIFLLIQKWKILFFLFIMVNIFPEKMQLNGNFIWEI